MGVRPTRAIPRTAGAADSTAVLLWLLLWLVPHDLTTVPVRMLAFLAIIMLPLAAAGIIASRCRAVTESPVHRCRNMRRGVLRRCEIPEHAGPNVYDLWAIMSVLLSVVLFTAAIQQL